MEEASSYYFANMLTQSALECEKFLTGSLLKAEELYVPFIVRRQKNNPKWLSSNVQSKKIAFKTRFMAV